MTKELKAIVIHKKDNSVIERVASWGEEECRPDFSISNIFHNSDGITTLSEGLCYGM